MELKPCPFCGAGAQKQGDEYSERIVCVKRCGGCTEWDQDIMISAWNTRATDPLLKEMAEALEQMADIYYGRDNQPFAGAYARKMDEVLQKYHELVGDGTSNKR